MSSFQKVKYDDVYSPLFFLGFSVAAFNKYHLTFTYRAHMHILSVAVSKTNILLNLLQGLPDA